MKYFQKEVLCPNGYKLVTKCRMPGYGRHGKRAPRSKPTSEAQAAYNIRKTAENLYILMLCNFLPGDYNLALTYPAGSDLDEQKAALFITAFIAAYRAYCKRHGYKCDYIYITEVSPRGKVHHHIILHNHRDIEIIEELWRQVCGGAVHYSGGSKLRSNYDWFGLAMYYVDRTKGGKYPDTHVKGKRRYNCSHGLRRPVVRIKWVEAKRWYAPKSNAEWELIPDSVRSGTHELTGASYIKYTMRRKL